MSPPDGIQVAGPGAGLARESGPEAGRGSGRRSVSSGESRVSRAARWWPVLVAVIVVALVAGSQRAGAQERPAVGATPVTSFDMAVRAYRAEDYALALSMFAELAEADADAGRRAILHANAGTAAARAQQLGEAVWHLEAAQRLAPRDPVVERNLLQVRQRLGEGDAETSQLTTWLLRSPLMLTRDEHRRALALGLTLVLLLVALRRLGWTGRWASALALAVLLLGAVWWWGEDAARAADLRRAVVMRPVAVRSEPSGSGGLLFRLSPGTVVEDAELRGDWRLIETDGGARGWVPAGLVRAAGA